MTRFALVAAALLAACHDDPKKTPDASIAIDAPADSTPDASPDASSVGPVEVALIPATENRDVDLLFIVDDSPSTLDKQTNLKNAFPTFATTLSALPGGLPNVHIGVVTSDVGTKGAGDAQPGPGIGSGPGSCTGMGKAGNLTTNAAVTGSFISDVSNGSSRTTNYTGTLASAFSAIASVGSAGCGFEQSIEAAKLALNNNPANAGFLRASASLAIIFVTDEDDCSLEHSTILTTDTSVFGPLNSFRCTRYGITCDQGGADADAMNQVGTKASCHSNESDQYLTKIADYVTFFQGLKPDPRNVLVAALAGDPMPVNVELRTPPGGGTPIPALAHSCNYLDAQGQVEVGDPAVRLTQLVDGFERNSFASVCSNDLTVPLADLAHAVGNMVGNPCIATDITDVSTCKVYDKRPNMAPVEIPSCTNGGATCYALDVDATACTAAQHYKLTVTRPAAPPSDTMVSVVCTQ